MSFEFIKKLPTPEEIRNQYPLDAELQALKEKRDAEIRDVFTGRCFTRRTTVISLICFPTLL